MKKILLIPILLSISFLLVIIFDPFNEVGKGQKRFFERELRASYNYINSKLTKEKTLPSDREFKEWVNANYPNNLIRYYSSKPVFMEHWCKESNCYVIGAWDGDGITYYQSWDGSFFYGKVE